MSEFPTQWKGVLTPASFGDTKPSKRVHVSPSEPQETSIQNSNGHLNHSPDISAMLFKETITILSDSESETEAATAENGEGSLQCTEVWPSVDTASFYIATAQTDNVNETQKHGAVFHGADEANDLYQLDFSTIGHSSGESTINTIFSASGPDSPIQTPDLFSTSPSFGLPQVDETVEESHMSVRDVKEYINQTPTSSASTPLDNVPHTPETRSFTQLSPDIRNISDTETSSNGISFVEPKSPTTRYTRRAKVLHAAPTLDGDGHNNLNRNYSGASNKTSWNNSINSESNDSDDGDDGDDGAVSEYSPSVVNSGGQEKHHLDNDTDSENEQPPRKCHKHRQSLAKGGRRIGPSTPRRESTMERDLPSPAVGAEYEEHVFTDGTTVKRTIIDGKEIIQIERPGGEDPWRLERPYAPQIQRNVTVSDTQGKKAIERAGNQANRSRRRTYTDEEDALLKTLRKDNKLSWDDTHIQFNNKFPSRRSRGSLQVRYTKIKE